MFDTTLIQGMGYLVLSCWSVESHKCQPTLKAIESALDGPSELGGKLLLLKITTYLIHRVKN